MPKNSKSRVKSQEKAQRRYDRTRLAPYNPHYDTSRVGISAGYFVRNGRVERIPPPPPLPEGWTFNERGEIVAPLPLYNSNVPASERQLVLRNFGQLAVRNEPKPSNSNNSNRGNKRRKADNTQISFTFGSIPNDETMKRLRNTLVQAFNNATKAPIETKDEIIEAQAQIIMNDFKNNNAIFPLELAELVDLLDGLNGSYHLAEQMGRQENTLSEYNQQLIDCLTTGDLSKLPRLISSISLYNGQIANSSLQAMQAARKIILDLQSGGQQLQNINDQNVQELNKTLEQKYYFEALSNEYSKLLDKYGKELEDLQIQHDRDAANLQSMTIRYGETTEEFRKRQEEMEARMNLRAAEFKRLEEDRSKALILYNNANQETTALKGAVLRISQTLGINSLVNNSLVDISNAIINETQKAKETAETLMKQADENTKRIEEQSQEIENYKASLEVQQANNRKQAQTIREQNIALIDLKESLAESQKQVEKREKTTNLLRDALFKAGDQVSDLRKQLSETEKQKDEIDRLGVNALMESEANTKRVAEEYEKRVATLEQENLELNREIDELRGVRGRLIATNQQLAAQVEAAHGEIEQVVADNAENVQQLARNNATLALARQNALLRTNDGINENFSQLSRLSREIDQGLAELQRTMENQMPESAGVFRLPPDPVPPINLDTQTVLLSQTVEVGRLVGAQVPQIVPRLDPPPVYRRGGETKVAERKVRRRPVLPKTDSKAKATTNNAKWIGKPIKQGGYVVGGRPDPYIHQGGAAFWKNLYKSNYHFL